MANELVGKVIILTGAAGGLGRSAAQRLAAAGACLALVDSSAERLADCIEALGGDTECYKGFPADLSNEESVQTMLDHVIDQFSEIDGLVHVVGGFAMGDPVHATKMDVFDKMMSLNARILYMVCGKVANYMLETSTQGSITAVLARSGQKGAKNQAAYVASKAAATRIVESMALELRDHGIRVNGISPSIIDTPANRSSMPNSDFDKWVKPEQIGDLMVFLASEAATAINGADIEISGRS
ncbi:MAG: SDR family oxidoreductase [Aggregatilineales bacterium]